MKTIIALSCLTIALVIPQTRAADSATEALQKGLLEEEANRDLNAAIQAYQSVINEFDEQRKLASTAIFRIAECYRKLGRPEDAQPYYARIVREFADQNDLVLLSNRHVEPAPLLAPSPGAPPNAPTLTPAQVQLIEEEIKLVESQLTEAQRRYANGRTTMAEIIGLRRELLGLKRNLPINTAPDARRAIVEEEIQLVEQLLAEMQKRIEVGAAAPIDRVPLQRELLALQRELAAIGTESVASIQPEAPDEEAKEIARLQEMARNSPDLFDRPTGGGPTAKTPLAQTASKGQLRVAEYLLRVGVDIDRPDGSGQTALHNAVGAGHNAMVELLLKAGAEVNAKNSERQTPLHYAATFGFKAVSETLLSHGADVNSKSRAARGTLPASAAIGTPLHAAAAQGHLSVARLLLDQSAEIDAFDDMR